MGPDPKDGPKRLPAIAALVDTARPEISYDAAYVRTTQTLDRLKRKGVVVFVADGPMTTVVKTEANQSKD